MKRKYKLIIFTLLIFIVVGAITIPIILSRMNKGNEDKIKELITNVDMYAKMETQGSGTVEEITKPMKVFIISNQYDTWNHTTSDRITYSNLMFKIDEKLMATKPDEVNTLIRIKYEYGPELTYDNGDKGVGASMEVTVIDIKSKKIMGTESFYDRPPSVKSGNGDVYGDFDMLKYEVVDFINKLGGF